MNTGKAAYLSNYKAIFKILAVVLLIALLPLSALAASDMEGADSGVFTIGSEQDVLGAVFSELEKEVEQGGSIVTKASPTIRIVDPIIDEKLIKGNVKRVVVEYTGLDLNTCRFSACLSKLVKGPQELTGNIVYDFASGGAVFRAGPNRGEIQLDTNRVSNGTYYLWVMFSDSASNTTGYNRIPINILTNTVFGWYEQSGGKWSFRETDGSTWVRSKFRQIVHNGNMEYFYFDDSGYMVTGWQTIGGKRYYFDGDGVMKRNGWLTLEGKQYYMDENGEAISDSWISVAGRRYYLAGGSPVKGLQTISGARYIFEDNGALAMGGKVTAGGKVYFANDDGTVYQGWKDKNYYQPEMASGGFYNIGGKTYGFDNNGKVCENGLAQIGSDYYLFANSSMLTGYQTVDGKTMYFIESGNDAGKRAKGPTIVNGGYLFFNAEGVREDGTGERQLDGRYYYIINGVPQTGEHGGRLYGSDFKAIHGFQNDVFYEHGQKQANKWVKDEGGKQYLLDGEGRARKGWIQAGGNWYHLDATTGELAVSKWVKDGSKWYYLKEDGVMATGWAKAGENWFYMNSAGVMQVGWQKVGSSWFYLKANGIMAVGWERIGGKWYYLKSSGAMATGWQKIDNKWYYLKASGVMATGWQRLGGKWYYLNPSSGAMATGTQTIGGKRYTFNSSGAWVS